MKFDKMEFEIWKNTWYILPTIIYLRNEPYLACRNFSIELHWLCLHFRVRWIAKRTWV